MRALVRAGAITLLTGLLLAGGPATADRLVVADANDTSGRMDIRRVIHGHLDASTVAHRVATYRRWRSRMLSAKGSGALSLIFSTEGNSCAEALVIVDLKDGRLRSRIRSYDPLGCGRGDDSGGFGEWRPIPQRPRRDNRRSITVFVPLDMLSKTELDQYRWSATTFFLQDGTPCSPHVCGDDAPDGGRERGLITHSL